MKAASRLDQLTDLHHPLILRKEATPVREGIPDANNRWRETVKQSFVILVLSTIVSELTFLMAEERNFHSDGIWTV
jgi:hypothetical protein